MKNLILLALAAIFSLTVSAQSTLSTEVKAITAGKTTKIPVILKNADKLKGLQVSFEVSDPSMTISSVGRGSQYKEREDPEDEESAYVLDYFTYNKTAKKLFIAYTADNKALLPEGEAFVINVAATTNYTSGIITMKATGSYAVEGSKDDGCYEFDDVTIVLGETPVENVKADKGAVEAKKIVKNGKVVIVDGDSEVGVDAIVQ